MFGNGVELHDGSAVEERDVVQTFERRNCGARAGVDENFVGGESALAAALVEANGYGMRARKTCIAEDQFEIRSVLQILLVAIAKSVHDVALALANALQVNADVTRAHAVIGAATREISNAGAGDHRFRGRAALVNTGATDVFTFDESRAQARICKRRTERIPTLAGTNYDGLKLLGRAHQ